MRRLLLAAACVAVAMLLTGCAGAQAGGGAVVRLSTPAATLLAKGDPGQSATATGTPIPPPELLLSTTDVYQAGAILVSLTGQITGGSVTFFDRKYQLTQGSQSMYAFVAVDADDQPGVRPLKVEFTLLNGSKGTMGADINVLRTQWTVDSVIIPDNELSLLEPAAGASELSLLRQVYGRYTPEKLWSEAWQMPAAGAITTRFGEQRSYNGAPAAGHHGGTDIGAPVGTPVRAANSGRVAMVRQLNLRGNMIIIDHGGGLFSGYAHLSSFAVAEGQTVAAGDVIGAVGNTGLSTGSHLHWEMSVGGILVDGLRFADGSDGF